MQSIKFAPDLFEKVLKGEKLSTVRLGLRDYTLGEVLLETPDSKYTIHGEITGLVKTQLSFLTEEDAKREGYKTLDDLLSRLKQIYPDITPDSVITVVEFSHGE